MQIDRVQFRTNLTTCLEAAQRFYSERPNGELAPSLLVMIDTGGAQWELDLIILTDFDEDRFDLIASLGAKYGSYLKKIPAIILTSEAWMSETPREAWEAHPENRIAPVDDPNRQEVLFVSGMTLDRHSELLRVNISRDEQKQAVLGEVTPWTDFDNRLLQSFWTGYATAYVITKRALLSGDKQAKFKR